MAEDDHEDHPIVDALNRQMPGWLVALIVVGSIAAALWLGWRTL